MQLGQVMVRSGAITAGQLDEGLRRQVVYGGRLGTNLIELGYADVDAVAHGLARLHRVPAALSRHLERHDPAVLALVPRELAERAAALPVAYSRSGNTRRLVVCMRDPGDREELANIERAAGLEVLVCVASEHLLFHWLARCYGIPLPRRHAHARPGQATPLPPITVELHAAPELDGSIDIDMDEVDDEIEMPAELRLVDLDHHDVERDQSQYGFATEGAAAALLESARREATPVPGFEATPVPVFEAPAAVVEAPPIPVQEGPPALTATRAIQAIAAAPGRDQVAEAVVGFMRGAFGAGLIFLARESLALGYRGFGGSFDDTTIESIVFPLTVPSVFQRAFETRETFRGSPLADGGALQDRFFKLFPLRSPPAEVLVVPVAIKDRIVCLFYAHGRDGGAVGERAVTELEQAAAATSEAFVDLIKKAKRGRAE